MARRWVHKTQRWWLIEDDELGALRALGRGDVGPTVPIVMPLGSEAIVSAKR